VIRVASILQLKILSMLRFFHGISALMKWETTGQAGRVPVFAF